MRMLGSPIASMCVLLDVGGGFLHFGIDQNTKEALAVFL